MSQALKHLLNKPSLHSRITTLFHHQLPVQFLAPPASNSRFTPNSNPFPTSKADDKNNITNFNGFHQVYPSFSFGYLLNPILSPPPSGLLPQFEPEVVADGGGDESKTMIWADSVKKKRKRKMNKHKLKKMRKSLRHCT